MKTKWDYTTLADAYLKRPEYASDAINKMMETAQVKKGDSVCDVGAGVAHLTLELLERGMIVDAVEPNDAMRANGKKRTEKYQGIQWFEGTGEETSMSTGKYDLVTFGSSFNVCDRPKALEETKRILKPGKWFACMWNHRDVNDKIQESIENIIKSNVEEYAYGTRREDQTEIINSVGFFGPVKTIEGTVIHTQTIADCVEAWRSHATLERQAGDKFHKVVSEIESYLKGLKVDSIKIPYTTRIWMAKLK